MEVNRNFVSLSLKGSCSVGLLDSNHMIIQLVLEYDYTRIFVRRTWLVNNSSMTVFKWMLDFKWNHELSIAPIWVNFPSLPLPFFNMKYLLKLGFLLGWSLQVDSATSSFKPSSIARVLIEIDATQVPNRHIWIGDENFCHWRRVKSEDWPSYCPFCLTIRHTKLECFKNNPSLKPVKAAI